MTVEVDVLIDLYPISIPLWIIVGLYAVELLVK